MAGTSQDEFEELVETLATYLARGMRDMSRLHLLMAVRMIEQHGIGGQLLLTIPSNPKDYPDVFFTPGGLKQLINTGLL